MLLASSDTLLLCFHGAVWFMNFSSLKLLVAAGHTIPVVIVSPMDCVHTVKALSSALFAVGVLLKPSRPHFHRFGVIPS